MNLAEFREYMANIKSSSLGQLGQLTQTIGQDLPKSKVMSMLYGHKTSSDLSGIQAMIQKEQEMAKQAQQKQQMPALIQQLMQMGARPE